MTTFDTRALQDPDLRSGAMASATVRAGARLRAALGALAGAVLVAAGMASPAVASDARTALIIGLSRYADPAVVPLRGVEHDMGSARTIARAMGIPDAGTRVIRNADATKAGLLAALRELGERTRDGSRAFIYFSGHGTRYFDPQAGGCVEGLLTYDGQVITNTELAEATQPVGLRADKLIVMLDACHSEGVLPAKTATTRGLSDTLVPRFSTPSTGASPAACSVVANYRTRGLFAETTRLGALRENVVMITSARPDEVSFDEPDRGGLATQGIRDCLLGKARDLDASGAVSLDEIRACAQSIVNERLRPFPALAPHTITLSGNRNLVPVPVSRPPVAIGAPQAAALTAGAPAAPATASPASAAAPATPAALVAPARPGAVAPAPIAAPTAQAPVFAAPGRPMPTPPVPPAALSPPAAAPMGSPSSGVSVAVSAAPTITAPPASPVAVALPPVAPARPTASAPAPALPAAAPVAVSPTVPSTSAPTTAPVPPAVAPARPSMATPASAAPTAAVPAAAAPAVMAPAPVAPTGPASAPVGEPSAPLASLATLADIANQADPRRLPHVGGHERPLRIGRDSLDLTVTPARDGYLYLVLLGSDARSFYLLFPNGLDMDNRVRAGQPLRLPREDWRIRAAGPAGINQLLVVVSDTPRTIDRLGRSRPDAKAPFTFALNTLGGRGALFDFLTSAPAGGAESFGARLVTVEEVK